MSINDKVYCTCVYRDSVFSKSSFLSVLFKQRKEVRRKLVMYGTDANNKESAFLACYPGRDFSFFSLHTFYPKADFFFLAEI